MVNDAHDVSDWPSRPGVQRDALCDAITSYDVPTMLTR